MVEREKSWTGQPVGVWLCLLLCLGLATGGCETTSSTASGNWQVPSSERQPFGSILIVALAPNERGRTAFEETLVNELAKSGQARGIATHSLGQQMRQSNISQDAVMALAQKMGADAVLMTRIVDQSAQDGHRPDELVDIGAAVEVSTSEDGSMTTVIASNHATKVMAGAQTVHVNNSLESSVYEVTDGDRPVYRAITRAQYDLAADAPVEMAAASFAEVLADRLRRDRVVR